MNTLERPRDHVEAEQLLDELRALSTQVEAQTVETYATWRPKVQRRPFALAASNFARYLALRRKDLRELQTQLMRLGLSSLGRCEGRVRPNLDAVISALAARCGDASIRVPRSHTFFRGERLLTAETDRVFGPRNGPHRVRILVTLPSFTYLKPFVRRGGPPESPATVGLADKRRTVPRRAAGMTRAVVAVAHATSRGRISSPFMPGAAGFRSPEASPSIAFGPDMRGVLMSGRSRHPR